MEILQTRFQIVKYDNQIQMTRNSNMGKTQQILFIFCNSTAFSVGANCVWARVNTMFKKAAQWPTKGERSSVSHIALIKKAEEQTICASRVVTVILKSSLQLHKVQYKIKLRVVSLISILLSLSQQRPGREQHHSQTAGQQRLTQLFRQTHKHARLMIIRTSESQNRQIT